MISRHLDDDGKPFFAVLPVPTQDPESGITFDRLDDAEAHARSLNMPILNAAHSDENAIEV